VVSNPLPADGGPRRDNSNQHEEPREKHADHDGPGNTNTLWTLYTEKAQSDDNNQIKCLEKEMKYILIVVRLCSVHAYNGFDHADARPHRLVYIPLLSPRS
jgi:hypothetical protein